MPTIISTEQQPMAGDEKNILRANRDKKLFFLLGSYITLAGVVFQVLYMIWDVDHPSIRVLFRYYRLHLSFLAFLLIILTIYFIRYYYKSVHPLVKDVRAGKKEVIFFVPGKYQTPFFAEYYLKTVIEDRSLIRINKELYDTIYDYSRACINMSLYSKFIFSVDIDGKKMKFKYSTLIDDL